MRRDDGYCKHGVYVGGSGIDWMCPYCEDGYDPPPPPKNYLVEISPTANGGKHQQYMKDLEIERWKPIMEKAGLKLTILREVDEFGQ